MHVGEFEQEADLTKVSPAGSMSSITSRDGVSPGSYQGGPKVSPYGLARQDTVSSFCATHKSEMEPIAEQDTAVSSVSLRRVVDLGSIFFSTGCFKKNAIV